MENKTDALNLADKSFPQGFSLKYWDVLCFTIQNKLI